MGKIDHSALIRETSSLFITVTIVTISSTVSRTRSSQSSESVSAGISITVALDSQRFIHSGVLHDDDNAQYLVRSTVSHEARI